MDHVECAGHFGHKNGGHSVSYPKRLLRLRPFRGLALDAEACEVSPEYWTSGSNVVFENGYARRVGGTREAYSQNTVDPVLHLLNVRAPGGITESNFWLAFGADEIQALETSNIDDVSGSALTGVDDAWQWSSTLLNNIPCFTNGLDAPRYWGGDVGTPAADLPNWPAGTICKSLVAFKHHLFALDIDGPSGHYESQILWSDAAPPGTIPATWTAAASNEAGDDILAETPGACLCGVPLQDTLLVFKRSSTYGVNYVGGDEIFSTRLLDGSRGALTRRAVVDIGGRLLVVSDGDVCLTDGVNWQSIAQGRVRNHIFTQMDQASYEMLFVVHDRSRNRVRIYYPTTGSEFCNEYVEYNVADDTFAVCSCVDVAHAAVGIVNDLSPDESWDVDADTWASDPEAWNAANFSLATEQLLVGADNDSITLQNSGDAVAIAANVGREDLTMGEPERFKYVRRVHARTADLPGDLYIRLGARNSTTEAITYGPEMTLTPPQSFINCGVMGKFISVLIRSEDEDEWRLSGIDLEYELRGYL